MNETTNDEVNSSESEDDAPEDENVTEMLHMKQWGENHTRRSTHNYQL